MTYKLGGMSAAAGSSEAPTADSEMKEVILDKVSHAYISIGTYLTRYWQFLYRSLLRLTTSLTLACTFPKALSWHCTSKSSHELCQFLGRRSTLSLAVQFYVVALPLDWTRSIATTSQTTGTLTWSWGPIFVSCAVQRCVSASRMRDINMFIGFFNCLLSTSSRQHRNKAW
jgi:hypothetical protein